MLYLEELTKIYKNCIKSKSWPVRKEAKSEMLSQRDRMADIRCTRRMLLKREEVKRKKFRPGKKCLDKVRKDLREMSNKNWIKEAKKRKRCKGKVD